MIAAPAAAPPSPPGHLGAAAPQREVLAYLGALTRWRDGVHEVLEGFDERSRAATDPDAFAGDVTLAFALWQAVTTRVDELVATWDSGRVGDKELEALSRLMWGRLDQRLDASLPVSFNEACTLLDAVVRRLADRLEADALARTGVGDRLPDLGAELARSEQLAARLGEEVDVVGALRSRYDHLVTDAKGGADVHALIDAFDRDLAPVARRLTVADALDRSNASDEQVLAQRLERAGQAEADARVLARRCTEKVTRPPRLAVPAVAVLGPVPTGGDREARRRALDEFADRLGRVEAALDEVHRRYAEPLDRRTELRGLLDAYHQMAARHGLAEATDLSERHGAARAALYQAPCDLDAARGLVEGYRDAVHRRTKEG